MEKSNSPVEKNPTGTTESPVEKNGISRRDFIAASSAVALFHIVPRHVMGGPGNTAPSDKLRIAGVGVGGMGGGNIRNMAGYNKETGKMTGENIVALCDIDHQKAAETFKLFPNAKTYFDYREMLEKQKDEIDAVLVATPDHTHACVAMAAMQLGKHVYVQKPMAQTVYQARKMTELAREKKVKTQMGNQGHSDEGVRLICEWIWDGAIGPVREVHAWTNRPIWPQGIKRPTDTPACPSHINWDLFLGPAPERPYHPAYHPFAWRGWWDYGCGALGDMACHILDSAVAALKLGYPTSVEACSTELNDDSFPLASMIHFEFPERQGMPPVKLHWYDGGLKPQRPIFLEDNRKLDQEDSGLLFIGEKGALRCGTYGGNPQILPYSLMKDYKKPEKKLPRTDCSHEENWIRACKKKDDWSVQANSNFDYAGPFTEFVVMGNLALKFPTQKLYWDGPNMKFTNNDEANAFVNPPTRPGWSI